MTHLPSHDSGTPPSEKIHKISPSHIQLISSLLQKFFPPCKCPCAYPLIDLLTRLLRRSLTLLTHFPATHTASPQQSVLAVHEAPSWPVPEPQTQPSNQPLGGHASPALPPVVVVFCVVVSVVCAFFSSTGGVTGVVVGVDEGVDEGVEEGVDVGVVVGALSPPYCWAGDVSPVFCVVSSTTASWTLGAVEPPAFCWTDFSRVWG